jgi:hypothetical protein
MGWNVNKTPVFVRCVEEAEVSPVVIEAIEAWAAGSNLTPSKKSRVCYRSPNNIFQIWSARLPDPDHNRGTSGGFRLTYFYLIKERAVYLDLIERRSDQGTKREHPKDQARYTQHINNLRDTLTKLYENP